MVKAGPGRFRDPVGSQNEKVVQKAQWVSKKARGPFWLARFSRSWETTPTPFPDFWLRTPKSQGGCLPTSSLTSSCLLAFAAWLLRTDGAFSRLLLGWIFRL